MQDKEVGAAGLSVMEAAKIAGLGRSTIYESISCGALVARKYGRRTVILNTDLHAWLNSLPTVCPSKARGA